MAVTQLVRYDAMRVAIREIDAFNQVKASITCTGDLKLVPDAANALEILNRITDHCWWYPKKPGVYVFDDAERILYVGESQNLRRRLLHHERGHLRRSIGVRCRIIACANHKQVEKWLIKALHPSLNGVSEFRRQQRVVLTGQTPAEIDAKFGYLWNKLFDAAA